MAATLPSATAAIAEPTPTPTADAPKEVKSVTQIDKQQIRDALTASRAQAKQAKARGISAATGEDLARQTERDSVVNEAAKHGIRYQSTDIDVLQLGGKLQITVPRDIEIESAVVTEYSDGSISADVEDSPLVPAEEAASVDPNPNLATAAEAPYEQMTDSGSYKITLLDAGTMWAYWERWVTKYDGNASYNYYASKRHAYSQPLEIDGLNWSVSGQFINSYPKPGYENVFLANLGSAPGSDNAHCGSGTLQVNMGPIEVGFPIPITCDDTDVTLGSPGRYNMYWSQPYVVTGGNKETAYVQSVKVPQGAEVRWSYQQRLEMIRWSAPSKDCGSTNSNKVCDPNG